jgi:hypothetical protein
MKQKKSMFIIILFILIQISSASAINVSHIQTSKGSNDIGDINSLTYLNDTLEYEINSTTETIPEIEFHIVISPYSFVTHLQIHFQTHDVGLLYTDQIEISIKYINNGQWRLVNDSVNEGFSTIPLLDGGGDLVTLRGYKETGVGDEFYITIDYIRFLNLDDNTTVIPEDINSISGLSIPLLSFIVPISLISLIYIKKYQKMKMSNISIY